MHFAVLQEKGLRWLVEGSDIEKSISSRVMLLPSGQLVNPPCISKNS